MATEIRGRPTAEGAERVFRSIPRGEGEAWARLLGAHYQGSAPPSEAVEFRFLSTLPSWPGAQAADGASV